MHNKIASIAGLLLAAGTASAATVSGRIVDEATQQPIAGAHLTVVSSIGGFQAIGPFADTDADGRYAFTFSDSQTQLLGIVAEAPGHAARDHGARRCNHPRS
ncbi:MAG TPA: carboxypeptidase-like regulatory domain-containing protein, partial [Tahibacter sp.]|nr:carboxypeptidase-like regulatory domain-containing protein [Tahibacter sp.]